MPRTDGTIYGHYQTSGLCYRTWTCRSSSLILILVLGLKFVWLAGENCIVSFFIFPAFWSETRLVLWEFTLKRWWLTIHSHAYTRRGCLVDWSRWALDLTLFTCFQLSKILALLICCVLSFAGILRELHLAFIWFGEEPFHAFRQIGYTADVTLGKMFNYQYIRWCAHCCLIWHSHPAAHLFKSSCDLVTQKDANILKKNIAVRFDGEEGMVCFKEFPIS